MAEYRRMRERQNVVVAREKIGSNNGDSAVLAIILRRNKETECSLLGFVVGGVGVRETGKVRG